MKYIIVFVLCLVALAAATPQLLAWPGFVAPLGHRTVVAGPTVVNEGVLGARVASAGVITSGII